MEPIPSALLKKYIVYARANYHPQLNAADEEKLVRVYTELRREAAATGSVAITVRHMESLIRSAEAHARIHLRRYVSSQDIDVAIRAVLDSFIQTQKFSVVRGMRRVYALSTHLSTRFYRECIHIPILIDLKTIVRNTLILIRRSVGTFMGNETRTKSC